MNELETIDKQSYDSYVESARRLYVQINAIKRSSRCSATVANASMALKVYLEARPWIFDELYDVSYIKDTIERLNETLIDIQLNVLPFRKNDG
jgi:hypothetical protein